MTYTLILATVPVGLQTAGLIVGIFLFVLWGGAILSRALIVRRATLTKGLVAASKDIGLTITAIPAIIAAIVLAVNNTDVVGIIAVCVVFIFGLITLQISRVAVFIYCADEQGITRYWFFFAKTLPWNKIDWVYPIRKTTRTYTPIGIEANSYQSNYWAIEAGRRKRLRIATDEPGGITSAAFKPILDQVLAHIPAKNVGYNQASRIRAERKAH